MNVMKYFLLIIALLLGSSVSGDCAPQKHDSKSRGSTLALRIELPKGMVYGTGSTVPVRIAFENTGSESIRVGFAVQGETGEQLSLVLTILDSSGNKASIGTQFRLSPFGVAGRDFLVTLAPNHFYGWTTKLVPFEYTFLNKPGDYEITASYKYAPPNEQLNPRTNEPTNEGRHAIPPTFSGELKSETIKLSIVANAPKETP